VQEFHWHVVPTRDLGGCSSVISLHFAIGLMAASRLALPTKLISERDFALAVGHSLPTLRFAPV
jgi:hypothetical protein